MLQPGQDFALVWIFSEPRSLKEPVRFAGLDHDRDSVGYDLPLFILLVGPGRQQIISYSLRKLDVPQPMTPKPLMPHSKENLAIVFADISKSVQLFERYGNVLAKEIVSHTLSIMTSLTNAHGGTVKRTIGDEVMSTFPYPFRALDAAVKMLRAISQDPYLSQYGLSIKVGLHFGEVLQENDELFGDAVNVAARMAGLAKANQIILTRSTLDHLPALANELMRNLGPVKIRGKQQTIDIVECLWQVGEDHPSTTLQGSMDIPQPQATLILRYRDQKFKITKDSFVMGRGKQNDLVVRHKKVSREHAYIEFGRETFVLVDQSTNGTFLRIGTDKTIFLHREQVHLRREGIISLGQDIDEDDAEFIYFRCPY